MKKVKTNNNKIEKEKKLVLGIMSQYSETFTALYEYDKNREKYIVSEERRADEKQLLDFITKYIK